MRARQSAGTAAAVALAGSAVTMVANFGIAVLVIRLGTDVAGVFFASTALVTILGNASALGAMTGLVYHLPTVLAEPDPNPRRLLIVAARPVVAVSGLAALALLLAGPHLGELLAGDRAAEAATMLRLLALAVPAWALATTALGATRGLGSMTPTVVANQLVRPLGQLLGLGALTVTAGAPSAGAVALAWGLPVVASAVVAVLAVIRLGGFATGGPCPVTPGAFWRYARPRAASTAFQIALERIDVVLVSALAGPSAAGVWGGVTRFVAAGNVLLFALGQSTSVGLRRVLAAGRIDRARRDLQRATGWMVLLAWPYFLLVATKAAPLTGLLDPTLTAGAGALALVALGMLANALAGPVDIALLMLGRSRSSLAVTAGALTIDVVVGVAAIPRYGLTGAALAWAAAVVAQNGIASVLVRRHGSLTGTGPGALVAATGALVAVVPVGVATPDTVTGLVVTATVAGLALGAWAVAFAAPLGLDATPAGALARRIGLLGAGTPLTDRPGDEDRGAGDRRRYVSSAGRTSR